MKALLLVVLLLAMAVAGGWLMWGAVTSDPPVVEVGYLGAALTLPLFFLTIGWLYGLIEDWRWNRKP